MAGLHSFSYFLSASPCISPLVTAPRALIILVIAVTSIIHFFFNYLARSWYLSLFLLSFNFTLLSARKAKCTFWQVVFFCWLLLELVVWLRIGDPLVSQNPRGVCVFHSPEQMPGCAYTICSDVQIQISAQFPVAHLAHSVVSRLILFLFLFAVFAHYVMDRLVSITT